MSKITKKTVVQYECTDGKAFTDAQEAQLHQMKVDALAAFMAFFQAPGLEAYLAEGHRVKEFCEFIVDDWEAVEFLAQQLGEALKPKQEEGKF